LTRTTINDLDLECVFKVMIIHSRSAENKFQK